MQVTDRAINLGCVVAYLLWGVVVTFLAAGLILRDQHIGQIGLGASAAAATATIRSYFVKSNQLLRNSLALRADDRVRSVR
jgi:hypothetical protein